MQLTEQEGAALERYRNTTYHYLLVDADRQHLALTMLRLFPVRTYGDLVIRWDDEITPERLVACGWLYGNYGLSSPGGEMYWFEKTRISHSELIVPDKNLPRWMQPRNMLDVWQLMERCGIEDNTNQRSQS